MRLYKMELYKICHRKVFVIGLTCVIGILMFYFYFRLIDEETCVDGIHYNHYQAVQVNRRISEEFRGVLTDEKVERIIERYGFPKEVDREYVLFFTDANFLNEWVTRYLSDGYFNSYVDYEAATCAYPIADTELGRIREITGKEIVLAYHDGWYIFFEVLNIGFLLGSILILITISGIFTNEKQTKMIPLLFTTKEGRRFDIYAKIAAAFTTAFCIWLGVVCLTLLLCGAVYGLDGLECMIGMTKIHGFISEYRQVSLLPVGSFLIITLVRSLIGILFLCAVTLSISAYVKSSFHALILAVCCWILPIVIWVMLPGYYHIFFLIIRIFINASPMYLAMYNAVYDYYRIYRMIAGGAAAVAILCTMIAKRRYNRLQKI